MFNRKIKVSIPGIGEVEDLRIAFKIEKYLQGSPNLGTISIYNLSENSRNIIAQEVSETSAGSFLQIQLFAGYEDTGTPLIFTGDIINAVPLKQDTDWVMELYCGDGTALFNDPVINETIPAGTTLNEFYDKLVSKMSGVVKGVTEGLTNCLSGKQSFLFSMIASGDVKTYFDMIVNDCGIEWFISDGVIESIQKGIPLYDEPTIIINQANGMIRSPERTEMGCIVTNFLLPSAKLGRTFKVEALSTKINIGYLNFAKVPPVRNEGIYRITRMVHSGDTHGNQWQSQLEGQYPLG